MVAEATATGAVGTIVVLVVEVVVVVVMFDTKHSILFNVRLRYGLIQMVFQMRLYCHNSYFEIPAIKFQITLNINQLPNVSYGILNVQKHLEFVSPLWT